jgi:hypothetical protein
MEQQSNSKLGTAALIIGLVSATSFFMLIVSAGAIIESTPWGMDEKSATTMVRILLYAVLGLSLLALVLGLAGLFQTERKKDLCHHWGDGCGGNHFRLASDHFACSVLRRERHGVIAFRPPEPAT